MNLDNQRDRPFWVKIALWGLATRGVAWRYFWLSVVIAVGCVAYGFVNSRFFLGAIMFAAAVWYYLAIRWVDQKGRWT